MIHTRVPGGTSLSVISPGEPGNSGGAAVYGRRSILYVYVLSLQFIPCTITITNFQFTGYPQTEQEHQESDDDIAQDCSCLV